MKRRIDNINPENDLNSIQEQNIRYCHSKRQTTSQSIPYNVETVVLASTDFHISDSGMSLGPDATITIKKSGLYLVSGAISWASGDVSTSERRLIVRVNGVNRCIESATNYSNINDRLEQTITVALQLTLNDIVTLACYHDRANLSALSIGFNDQGSTKFCVALISDRSTI